MSTPGLNIGQGIDITIRDGVAPTISPKLQGFATDAVKAEGSIKALEAALNGIKAGNLTSVSTAATAMRTSVGNAAVAIDRVSDAAAKADGNLQRLVMQLQVVSAAANQATTSFNSMGA